MKAIFAAFVFLLILQPAATGQGYFTLGGGFGFMFPESGDLDNFTDTYNSVNAAGLAQPLEGFGGSAGAARVEGGYRWLGKPGGAVLLGWFGSQKKDVAAFGNGETRGLELKITGLYLETELGYYRDNFFLNGSIGFVFNRTASIESQYSNPLGSVAAKSLNGTYKGTVNFSTDLGIVAGFLKEPLFLMFKIAYPVYRGSESEELRDKNSEKITSGTDKFPSDYVAYVNSPTYPGVASNINGLKLWLTVGLAIPAAKVF